MTRGMLGRLVVLGAIAAGVWGSAAAVQAQQPLYGFVNLRAGFMPDPHIMNGMMGGTIQASQFAQNCRGTVNPQPSHIVRTQTGFRNIRFVVNGQGDSTLMVMLPNGQVLCDDDGGEGLNPLIQTSSPPGDIRIWVGVYSQSNQGRPYTMGVTELAHITANHLTAAPGPVPGPIPVPGPQPVSGISPSSPPVFGGVNLRAGFMPDPHVVAGTAGGPVSAQAVDQSCRGYVSPQPSHLLVTQTGFSQIRIAVNGGSLDTTLMVMLPNGQVVCNDDSEGFNPLVAFSTGPGTVRVWVGTYSQGRSGPYNIGFSELGHVGPSTIPQPGGVVVANPGPAPVPVQPPQPAGEVVQMQVSTPVTLLGPGLDGNTIAVWQPGGAPPTRVTLSGRAIVAGGVSVATLPPSMRDPIVTVMQQRAGTMIVRAEQPPMGRGDRGETVVLLVAWQGRPIIQERWSGRYGAREPRWAR